MIYNSRGQTHSRISFRSDDDNDDIPSSSTFTQLRRYGFSSIIILHYPYAFSSFSQYNNNNPNRFFFTIVRMWYICMRVCVCVHLQRSSKCAMLHCNRWSVGRSNAHIGVFVSEFTTSIKGEKKKKKKRK
jgi:hypothetical protein